MAELKTLCIDNICMDNSEYSAGDYIDITNGEISVKQGISSKNFSNVSVPHNSWVSKEFFTVPKTGTVILEGYVRFAANATGRRTLETFKGSTAFGGTNVAPAPQGETSFTFTALGNVTAGQKITSRVFQYSGSTLNVPYWHIGMWYLEK